MSISFDELQQIDKTLTRVNNIIRKRYDNHVFHADTNFSFHGFIRAGETLSLYKPRVNIMLKKIEPNDTELCFMIIITLGECQTNKPYVFYIQFSLPIEDEPKEILNNLKVNFRLNFGVSTYSSFTKAYIQHVLDVISGFIGSANNIVWVCALGFTVEQYYQNYGYTKTGIAEYTNSAIRLIPLSSLPYGGLAYPIIQVDIFKPYYNVTTGEESLFLTRTHDRTVESSSTKFKHVYTYSNIYNAYTLGYNSLLTNI